MIKEDILEILSKLLGKKNIDPDVDFFVLGGDSLKFLILVSEINKKFNTRYLITDIYMYRTVNELAVFIADEDKRELSEKEGFVIHINNNSSASNFYLIHDVSGEISSYLSLCDYLNNDFNFIGFKYHMNKRLYPSELELDDYVDKFVKHIIHNNGIEDEINIGGWSIGGIIAFEIANQLHNIYNYKIKLYLFDSPSPGFHDINYSFSFDDDIQKMKDVINLDVPEKLKQSKNIQEFWEYFYHSILDNPNLLEKIYNYPEFKPIFESIPNYSELPIRDLIESVSIWRTITNACYRYKPEKQIKSKTYYFFAKNSPARDKGWIDYCPHIVESEVDGDHFSILKTPDLICMGNLLKSTISLS